MGSKNAKSESYFKSEGRGGSFIRHLTFEVIQTLVIPGISQKSLTMSFPKSSFTEAVWQQQLVVEISSVGFNLLRDN